MPSMETIDLNEGTLSALLALDCVTVMRTILHLFFCIDFILVVMRTLSKSHHNAFYVFVAEFI